MLNTTKRCSSCTENKPHSEFHKNKSQKDGHANQCKSCSQLTAIKGKDRILLYKKQYRADNKESILNKQKMYYSAHKKERSLYYKKWRSTENGKIVGRSHSLKTKAKRKLLTSNGDVTTSELKHLILNRKDCYWCRCSVSDKYHIDHYTPLSKGGKHTISNLVISCPLCNLQKGSKDPIEFAQSRNRLF